MYIFGYVVLKKLFFKTSFKKFTFLEKKRFFFFFQKTSFRDRKRETKKKKKYQMTLRKASFLAMFWAIWNEMNLDAWMQSSMILLA